MLSIATNQFASFCIDIRSRQCYFQVCQSGEIWNKKAFFPYILIFYYIKQIDSMLPCVCSVTDDRGCQNVVRTSVTHSAAPRVPLFCSYHILTSSVIYYWTDARQHGIYLLTITTNHLPKQTQLKQNTIERHHNWITKINDVIITNTKETDTPVNNIEGNVCHVSQPWKENFSGARHFPVLIWWLLSSLPLFCIISLTNKRYGRFDHEDWCTHKVIFSSRQMAVRCQWNDWSRMQWIKRK